jgi:hypothetical protein
VLAELSYFFLILCAKELSKKQVKKLEEAALVLLCKLEKIYPSGFFNPMQHMILHLSYEARMGGPVHGRWCYSIERVLKVLRTMTRNKNKIEASIAEAYCTEEVTNFTTKTMLTHFQACIIQPLATMPTKMNRTSASSKGNSEEQVLQLIRSCNIMSGALS